MAGEMERPMPLARYFYYVGGVLLALLFIADAFLPKLPSVTGLIRFRTSSAFTLIGNGQSALFTTPASRPSSLHRSRTWRKAPRPRQRSRLPRRGAGSICATATVRCQPATIIRFKKARTEAAAPTQNSKATRTAARAPGGAATAIRLVCLLVSRG